MTLKIHYLDRDEIPDIFNDADYFMLPYREVTQSGPLMLSFHFGVTPVTSDIGGFQELIKNGENGFTFRSEDASALANVMDDLLNQSSDYHQDAQKRLRSYVTREYDVQKFAGEYINMFQRLIG